MEEKKISFETAKLAKVKGFPQDLFNTGWYNRVGRENGITNLNEDGIEVYCTFLSYQPKDVISVTKEVHDECTTHSYLAPTQSLLQKWLRDEHNIHIDIMFDDNTWSARIGVFTIPDFVPDVEISINEKESFEDSIGAYDEILEAGLLNALKLIKL